MYKDAFFAEIIKKYDRENVSDEQIVELINILVNSGERIQLSKQAFDFASTGGPSSLTTLLVPLYLYGMGVGVINLAVPGRPAGAVDVLSQIEGYTMRDIKREWKFETPFYIHLIAEQNYAPLDRELFEYRKKVGKVNVPNLAIASLLSKKIVSGASNIGLDVRVSDFGNFGRSWNECIDNAKKFNHLANMLGIQSTCFLSDANSPYQKYIGRGEALEALYDIFEGKEDVQLKSHCQYCEKIASTLIEKARIVSGVKQVNLKQCFEDNLLFQESKYCNFLDAVERIKEQPRTLLYAEQEGYLKYNLNEIRNYLVERQKLMKAVDDYPDPCGVKLLCQTGKFVTKDMPILSVRNFVAEDAQQVKKMFGIYKSKIINESRKEVI